MENPTFSGRSYDGGDGIFHLRGQGKDVIWGLGHAPLVRESLVIRQSTLGISGPEILVRGHQCNHWTVPYLQTKHINYLPQVINSCQNHCSLSAHPQIKPGSTAVLSVHGHINIIIRSHKQKSHADTQTQCVAESNCWPTSRACSLLFRLH